MQLEKKYCLQNVHERVSGRVLSKQTVGTLNRSTTSACLSERQEYILKFVILNTECNFVYSSIKENFVCFQPSAAKQMRVVSFWAFMKRVVGISRLRVKKTHPSYRQGSRIQDSSPEISVRDYHYWLCCSRKDCSSQR